MCSFRRFYVGSVDDYKQSAKEHEKDAAKAKTDAANEKDAKKKAELIEQAEEEYEAAALDHVSAAKHLSAAGKDDDAGLEYQKAVEDYLQEAILNKNEKSEFNRVAAKVHRNFEKAKKAYKDAGDAAAIKTMTDDLKNSLTAEGISIPPWLKP